MLFGNNDNCSSYLKYCTGTPNSTGSPADLIASGSLYPGHGNLTLSSQPVPNQPGIFFHGDNPAQIPFGNGFLCTTGGIVRGAVLFASANAAHYVYDNSDAQHGLGGFIGQTRNFQYWYRDPMGGGAAFNLSNAITMTVQANDECGDGGGGGGGGGGGFYGGPTDFAAH